MSKKNGSSLCLKNDGLLGVSVSRLDHGRWSIDKLEQSSEQSPSASALAQELGKSPDRLTMMVPGEAVRNSLISLPKLKKKELNQAVSGWVAREESTPLNEWRVSWREHQGRSGEGNTDRKDIFLIYSAKEEVDRQMAAAESWGSKPTRILPDYLILDAMFRRYHPDVENLEAWNIVFIGKEEHFLSVSTQGSLLLTRPLPGDLSEGSDAKEYLERLATEVDRSVFFARQTEFNPDIQRIIVCGDSELAQGLIEQLKEETAIPAEFWDVAGCFEWEGGTLDSRHLLPAMAAALDLKKVPFNLLPSQTRILLGARARKRFGLGVATAAIAVIPILVVGGYLTGAVQDRYLERARLQLDDAKVRADAAAEVYKAERVLSAKEEHIASFHGDEQDYAGILLHLADLTPNQVLYKDLRLRETNDGRLVLYLSGESNSETVGSAQQSFLVFQRALKRSRLLISVGEPRKLVISNKNDKGEDVKKVEFSMEFRVEPVTPDQGEVVAIASLDER